MILRSTTLLPILCLLIAAVMWGTVWYPLRLLETHGLGGLWTIVVSYGAAMLVGIQPLIRRRDELWHDPLALTVMMLAVGWCNVAFVLAVLEGTIVRVLLLFYLSPLWAVLLARVILKEKLSREAKLVFIMALSGAMIMLWNPRIGMPWPRGPGDWLAVSSGFGFALSNVMIRRMQSLSLLTKASVSWAGVLIIAIVMLLATGKVEAPVVTPGVWAGAVVLGWLGFVVMTLTVQYGVTHMPIHRSAVILLFELVAGAVSSHLLAEEIVLLQEWVGGALIVSAAYVSARAASTRETQTEGA